MNYLDTKVPIVLFQHCLNSELYVDKSLFIRQVSKNIRTGNRYICLTRPRRFGKTVNAGMLGACFTKGYDTHSQFDSLAIAQSDSYEKHLNQYHVIYIDCSRMPDFCSSYEQYLKSVIARLKEDLLEAYPGLRGRCLNYWTETGPMNEIADCIEHNVDEVREDIVKLVAGIPVSARLKGYSAAEQRLNTRDEILSAMAVYGFLSYYDGELKIPNRELMEKYQEILERESFGGIREIVESSRERLL